jgi:hypothetical protein
VIDRQKLVKNFRVRFAISNIDDYIGVGAPALVIDNLMVSEQMLPVPLPPTYQNDIRCKFAEVTLNNGVFPTDWKG